MGRRLVLLILAACATAWAASTFRLYLTDGEYHVIREYTVQGDNVRYFSTERGEWEDIPVSLVDLKKTETELKRRKDDAVAEAKLLDAEDRAIRAQENEIARIPQEPGVHWINGKELVLLKPAETKIKTSGKRKLLQVITPIPVVSGKSTVELDGPMATLTIRGDRPEFYIRLSSDQRFGIAKLEPAKDVRIVERIDILPVVKEMIEQPNLMEVFRQQVDDGLYKIWPMKALEPGEYAVIEYTEGKVNLQVWDFTLKPVAQ